MSIELTKTQLHQWHRAIFSLFLFLGFSFSAWMSRLPEVRGLLGVTTSQLGLILVFGSIGSLIMLSIAGRLMTRFGTRPLMLVGYLAIAVSSTLQAFAAQAGLVALVAVAGFFLGAAYGTADVAINVDGGLIEAREGRSLMPRMHAMYSLGALSGAGVGAVFSAWKVPIYEQQLGLNILTLLVPLIVLRRVPTGTGIEPHEIHEKTGKKVRPKMIIDSVLVMLALGILGISLAEGGAGDWLAIGLVDDYKVSTFEAGIAFAIFNGAMTLTRFFGGSLVDRWGRRRALEVLALAGVCGVLTVILSGNLYLAWMGAALWGVGVALGFPLFISAAGDSEANARRVALVAACGYTAFLVGPPLLGLLGQAWGVLNMFWVLASSLALVILFARGTQPRG